MAKSVHGLLTGGVFENLGDVFGAKLATSFGEKHVFGISHRFASKSGFQILDGDRAFLALIFLSFLLNSGVARLIEMTVQKKFNRLKQ